MRAPSGDSKGRRAELIAEIWLRLKGYRILKRRFRTGQGEIDLIAQRARTLAFIEVKYRPSLDLSLEAVSTRQQRRIASAANAFLAIHPRAAQCTLRFDVVVLAPRAWPRHILNAWSANGDNRG